MYLFALEPPSKVHNRLREGGKDLSGRAPQLKRSAKAKKKSKKMAKANAEKVSTPSATSNTPSQEPDKADAEPAEPPTPGWESGWGEAGRPVIDLVEGLPPVRPTVGRVSRAIQVATKKERREEAAAAIDRKSPLTMEGSLRTLGGAQIVGVNSPSMKGGGGAGGNVSGGEGTLLGSKDDSVTISRGDGKGGSFSIPRSVYAALQTQFGERGTGEGEEGEDEEEDEMDDSKTIDARE